VRCRSEIWYQRRLTRVGSIRENFIKVSFQEKQLHLKVKYGFYFKFATSHFYRNNYELWSLTMKASFLGQDVGEEVQNGYVEPKDHETYNALTKDEKDDLKYQRKRDGQVIFYIHQDMNESILPRVA